MDGIKILGPMGARYSDILTQDALAFIASLHRNFDGQRKALLAARAGIHDFWLNLPVIASAAKQSSPSSLLSFPR